MHPAAAQRLSRWLQFAEHQGRDLSDGEFMAWENGIEPPSLLEQIAEAAQDSIKVGDKVYVVLGGGVRGTVVSIRPKKARESYVSDMPGDDGDELRYIVMPEDDTPKAPHVWLNMGLPRSWLRKEEQA